jgi:hypothetical protein
MESLVFKFARILVRQGFAGCEKRRDLNMNGRA